MNLTVFFIVYFIMAIGVKERNKEGENKPTRYYSARQERAVAKSVGGKQTANSGATMFQKGDIKTDGEESFLIECKTKTSHSDSISFKKEWIEKNKQEAAFMGKQHQAVVFNFGPDEENYYVIEEYLFKELLEYLKKD